MKECNVCGRSGSGEKKKVVWKEHGSVFLLAKLKKEKRKKAKTILYL